MVVDLEPVFRLRRAMDERRSAVDAYGRALRAVTSQQRLDDLALTCRETCAELTLATLALREGRGI